MPNLTDIPGISQIWTRTKGDPRVKIAILDSAADWERSCFQWAKFSQYLGQFAKDRALNFSVTNAFQAASSFSQAISTGMQLDSIEVEKSPFCRINSDCWDVKLKFFDPENGRRAKKVYLFTIDVSDRIPVTLGQVRSWSVRK